MSSVLPRIPLDNNVIPYSGAGRFPGERAGIQLRYTPLPGPAARPPPQLLASQSAVLCSDPTRAVEPRVDPAQHRVPAHGSLPHDLLEHQ